MGKYKLDFMKIPKIFTKNQIFNNSVTVAKITVFLICLLISSSLGASEEDSLPQKKHYKVGYREQYYPYEFTNAYGHADGYSPALLRQIAGLGNISLEFIPVHQNDLFNALSLGKVDLIACTSTPERAQLFALSVPNCQITQAYFALYNKCPQQDIRNLTLLTFGYMENNNLPAEFNNRSDLKKRKVFSKLEGFMLLEKKEIDVFYADEKNGIKLISDYGYSTIKILSGGKHPQNNVFATLPENQEIIRWLDREFLKLQKAGKVTQLQNKWLSDQIFHFGWAQRNLNTLILALSFISIAFILLLFWNRSLRRAVNRKTKAILDSEEKYRYMFQNNPQMMMIYDLETLKFIEVNASAVKNYGYSKDEFLALTLKDIRIEGDLREFLSNVELAKDGEELKLECTHRKKSGELFDVESRAYSLNYKGIKARHVLVNDITERKKAEKALLESEEKYSILFKYSPDAYLILENGVFTDCNTTTERMLGMDRNSIIGKTPDDLSPEFQPDGSKSSVSKSFHILSSLNQGNHTFEWAHQKADGSEILVEVTLATINLAGKQTIFTTWRDISNRKAAELLLYKERTLLRSLIDNIPETIFCKDLQSKKTLSNKAEIKLLGGKTEADILGKDDYAFFPKEYAEKYIADDKLIMESGQAILDIVEQVMDSDGNSKWILTSKIPLRDENNQVIGLIGISRDITQQKNHEEILQNERHLLRTIIDNIPDTIYLKDIHAKKVLANLADIKKIQRKEADILGKDDLELFPKEIAEKFYADDMMVLKTGQSIVNQEEFLTDENGNRLCILTTKIPLKDINGNVTGLLGIGRDITDRKIAEDALKESEKFLKNTQQIAQLGTLTFDLNTGCWESSEVSDNILGIDKDFPRTPESARNIVHPEWEQKILQYFQDEVISNNTKFDYKTKIIRQNDGQERWIHAFGELILNEENLALKIIGTIQDITSRKELAEKLRKSEALYSSILNSSPDLIVITNTLGCIEYLSPGFVNHLGYKSEEEFFGHNIMEFLYKDDIPKAQEEIFKAFRGDKILIQEYRIIKQDNSLIQCEVNGDLILNDKSEPVNMILVIRDITDRKLTEQALKQSQDNYRTMIDYSNDLIWTVDNEGNFTFFNEIASKTTGLNTTDWIGKSFLPLIMDEDKAEIISVFEKNMKGQSCSYELRFKKSATEILTILVNSSPIYTDGKVDGVVSFGRDITDRKKIEEALNKSEEKLKNFASHLQNVREEERVILAREIHDDLGQILIALKIDLGILKQKVLKENEGNYTEFSSRFEQLVDLVDNTIKTTRKIMTGLRPEVLELLGFIESARIYTIDFENRYKIDCRFENKITELHINSQQSIALYRILQEALTNVARHAKATKVNVSIYQEDKNLVMKITDNGIGFSENKSTKSDSYGLIGMKERVFLLGGELTINGQQAFGTEVKISVPHS